MTDEPIPEDPKAGLVQNAIEVALRFYEAGGVVTLSEWMELTPELQWAFVKARRLWDASRVIYKSAEEPRASVLERVGQQALREARGG